MAAYFSIAAMIRILLENGDFSQCLPWCGLLLIGYLVKSVGSAWSTSMSHTATYYTLQDIRKKMLAKLSRVPMGTILDTPSGQYKTTIVDRVEGMEPTLAHLIPEMTANLLVPVAIAVYIFALDWRMGFASLVATVIGMAIMSQSGKTYAVRWEGAVAVGKRMANAIIEYVGGIQVVKAFSQFAVRPDHRAACRTSSVVSRQPFRFGFFHHYCPFHGICGPVSGGFVLCG